MGKVQLLADDLINQIAAEEVVERPASVVKELAENAIDAGAGRIEVELERGGKQLIRVVDDGCGMTHEDALMALQRHATSKLRSHEDLFRIMTMGFRGEAIPSIASVSRFVMETRNEEEADGVHIEVLGGKPPVISPVGRSVGTTVEVHDLFFNVPARRKFLKADNTEVSHTAETLTRLALAHPEVRFKLTSNRRMLLHCAATHDMRERIGALLGRPIGEAMHPFEMADGWVKLRGYFSRPDITAQSPKGIYLFVNGRFIRHRSFAHACQEAYRGAMEKGRYPHIVLFLEIDPAEVDVNVHPQKIEVRFHRETEIYNRLYASLRNAIARTPWVERGRGRLERVVGAALPEASPETPEIPPFLQEEMGMDHSLDDPEGAASFVEEKPLLAQTAEGAAVSHEVSMDANDSMERGVSEGLDQKSQRAASNTANRLSMSDSTRSAVRNTTPSVSASAFLTSSTSRAQVSTTGYLADSAGATATRKQETTEAPKNFDEFRARFLKAAQDQKSAIEEPPEDTRFAPLPSAQKNLPFLPNWNAPLDEDVSNPLESPNLLGKKIPQAERPEGIPVRDGAQQGRVGFFSSLRYIGQFAQMYLLFEHQDRLILLDQHAAHERVTYQKLLEGFLSSQIPQQVYLVPPQIELGIVAAQQAEQFQEELERLGVSIEPFGGQSFILRAVPVFLKEAEPLVLINDLLEEVAKGYKSASLDQRRDALLMRMACHGSVRGAHKLSVEEVRALLQQLDEIEFKGHCPHGRPIFFEMARTEIEKRFHRT